MEENERERLDEYHEPDGTHPMHVVTKREMLEDAQGKTTEVENEEKPCHEESSKYSHPNFTTGENVGAKILRHELKQIMKNGRCVVDICGEELNEDEVKAARALEMD